MKTTAQRLSEVFCRPKTEEEWKALGVNRHSFDGNHDCVIYLGKTLGWPVKSAELNGYTEIPVTHFDDLTKDKIASWRLEEDGIKCVGFSTDGGSSMHGLNLTDKASALMVRFPIDGSHPVIRLGQFDEEKFNQVTFKGCKTYTDLLTLIKLIG
jgi:hypothetical protein